MVSAVSARGAFWANTYDGKLNAGSFELFLKDFMRNRRGEKVFLAVDGRPGHTAKIALNYVEGLKGRLARHPPKSRSGPLFLQSGECSLCQALISMPLEIDSFRVRPINRST